MASSWPSMAFSGLLRMGSDLSIVVGCGPDGQPAVVLDILPFEGWTAEQSLTLANKKLETVRPAARGWDEGFPVVRQQDGAGLACGRRGAMLALRHRADGLASALQAVDQPTKVAQSCATFSHTG